MDLKIIWHHCSPKWVDVPFEGFIWVGQRSRSCGIDRLSMDNLVFLYLSNVLFTEESELRRTLQSLACGKARVLQKMPRVGSVKFLAKGFFCIFFLKKTVLSPHLFSIYSVEVWVWKLIHRLLTVWCSTQFSTLFQSYCGSQFLYPFSCELSFTSTSHNTPWKPLEASLDNHHWNKAFGERGMNLFKITVINSAEEIGIVTDQISSQFITLRELGSFLCMKFSHFIIYWRKIFHISTFRIKGFGLPHW